MAKGQPGTRGSDGREKASEDAFARLLELQTAEADRHRQEFEARLNMPIDAGAQILDRMKTLREELEDLLASDPSTSDADNP